MTKADLIALINGTLNNSVPDGSISPETVASLLRDMVNFTDENDSVGEVLYKARLVQSGTSAPVITEYINNTGNTITASRGGVGIYAIEGFAGTLVSGNFEVTISEARISGESAYVYLPTTGNAVGIQTYDASGAFKDGVLLGTTGDGSIENYNIITVKKYPIVS